MAHQIDTTSLGRASYASTEKEWHFGQTNHAILRPGAPIEEWLKAAGMEYTIQRGFIRYATERLTEDAPISKLQKMADKVVLFRNDTGAPLGVVSPNYNVLQPKDVGEAMREYAAAAGLQIESAGVLFGGKRYFATAKMDEGVFVDGSKDKVVPYLLLSTSADGSLATEGRWTTVRVVCNNTLSMARDNAAAFRLTHRSRWDPQAFKTTMESAHEEFGTFMRTARMLAGVKVTSRLAEDMTTLLFKGAKQEADAADKARESKGFATVMSLFSGGAKGAMLESARGTAWGWLNAVTEYADHHVRAQSEENRLVSATWGQGADLKNKAVEIALAA